MFIGTCFILFDSSNFAFCSLSNKLGKTTLSRTPFVETCYLLQPQKLDCTQNKNLPNADFKVKPTKKNLNQRLVEIVPHKFNEPSD